MAHGKPSVLAPQTLYEGPPHTLTEHTYFTWCGEDIRELPKEQLLEIIVTLGHEVKTLREETTRLQLGKFRR